MSNKKSRELAYPRDLVKTQYSLLFLTMLFSLFICDEALKFDFYKLLYYNELSLVTIKLYVLALYQPVGFQ